MSKKDRSGDSQPRIIVYDLLSQNVMGLAKSTGADISTTAISLVTYFPKISEEVASPPHIPPVDLLSQNVTGLRDSTGVDISTTAIPQVTHLPKM
ncbi:RNA-directed RNA polymerase VP2 [Trichinella pseudospiralis]